MFPPRSIVHFSLFLSTASCITAHSSFFRTFMCSIHLRPPTTAQRSHSHAICNGGGRERERSAFAALSFSVCKTAPLSPSLTLSLSLSPFAGSVPVLRSRHSLYFGFSLYVVLYSFTRRGVRGDTLCTRRRRCIRGRERERERERSKGFSKD